MTVLHLSDRATSGRAPAWHGLGTAFDPALRTSATEAFKAAGLDWKVAKFPIYVRTRAGFQLVTGRDGLGGSHEILLREPDTSGTGDPNAFTSGKPIPLGVVTSRYEPIQNMFLAGCMDPITKHKPIVTVGHFDDGKRIFLCLDAGDADVQGDPIRKYHTVAESKDGGGSVKSVFSPVRVICRNTLALALSTGQVNFSIGHYKDANVLVRVMLEKMREMDEKEVEVVGIYNRLALSRIVDAQVDDILKAAYPEPKPSRRSSAVARMIAEGTLVKVQNISSDEISYLTDRALKEADALEVAHESAREHRNFADTLYRKFNDEHPKVGGTAWAAWQAVVELEDYKDGRGNVGESALFGERARTKTLAFKRAVEIAGVELKSKEVAAV